MYLIRILKYFTWKTAGIILLKWPTFLIRLAVLVVTFYFPQNIMT